MTKMSNADRRQEFSLQLEGVSRRFGPRIICADVSLSLQQGDCLAVVGPNGSGKSTFLKMLGGLLRPDSGTISYFNQGQTVRREHWFSYVSLVAPDLALYAELTARENLTFFNKIGGWGKSGDDLLTLIDDLGLGGRADDLVGTFSSGMKQRLKYAAALVKDPPLLLLDEPTSNFDEAGRAIFIKILNQCRSTGIVVIATNDAQEAEFAGQQVVMGG